MNAADCSRLANARLVGGTMNVNITGVRVHVSTAIETGFESFEPQNARGDFGVWHSLPGIANWPATFKNRSRRPAAANLFHNSMQSQWRAIQALRLPDAEP